MDSSVHPLIGQLKPIFSELHSSTASTLQSVILKLKYVIEDESDTFLQGGGGSGHLRASNSRVFTAWINSQIEDLFSKPETRFSGVLCVETLLGVEYMDGNDMTRFFARVLENCVLTSNDLGVAEKAAEVWGRLLSSGGSIVEGLAQSQLGCCIQTLQRGGRGPSLNEKVAAVLFLRQLFRQAPSTVLPQFDSIAEGLRVTVCDPSRLVRSIAASTLHDALLVIYTSLDASTVQRWQEIFLFDARRGLQSKSREQQNGAIQCFNAVLSSVVKDRSGYGPSVSFSPAAKQSVQEVWQIVNNNIAELTIPIEIKEDLLYALTYLAGYDPVAFRERSVKQTVAATTAIFRTQSSTEERAMMLLAVGRLAYILQDQVPLFLGRMMPHIIDALVRKGKNERCLEAVTCFATLAEVNPKAVRPYLRQTLVPLFSGPPTVGFAKDIARICIAFPELRSTCLSKILEATKVQLVNAHHRLSSGASEGNTSVPLQSLSALSTLDFSGYSTLPFLCDAVVRYTSFPHEEVRRAAINLCFQLVLSGCRGPQSPCKTTPEGVVVHHGRDHTRLINTVIKKLVNAAVADPESDIRLHTLESFTEEYDHTLALQDIVSSLFPALHDKHQNRIVVVRLLGRLSRRNPAHVYPMLRRIMVQCVTEMQFFEHAKKLEQAFSVLDAIVESAPGMGKPYVSSLLNICVARLREPTQPAPVLSSLLSCIGKLVRYAESDDVRVAANIRPIVVQHILDSSHLPKKREALRTLGDIVRTTRDVRVYEDHPELLSVFLQALHGGFKESWPVRNDVLQLMGIIGAVDPMLAKEILREARANNNAVENIPSLGTRGEDSVAQTVVRSALQILSLPSLTDEQCIRAVEVVVNVLSLKEVSSGCLVSYYAGIISSILKHARALARIRGGLLGLLTTLVGHLKEHVRVHLDDITTTTAAFIPSSDPNVLGQILALLRQLRRSFRDEFRPHLAFLLIPIVGVVQENPENTCEKVFDFFSAMGSLLEDHLHNVLPAVCDVVANSSFPHSCRMAALYTLISFAQQLSNFNFHASRCVHCLCRVLKEVERGRGNSKNGVNTSNPLGDTALTALHAIAQNLGSGFEKFTPMVFPVVAEYYGEMSGGCKNFYAIVRETIRSRNRTLLPELPCHPVDKTGLCPPLSGTNNNNNNTSNAGGGLSGATVGGVGIAAWKRPTDSFASLRLLLRTRDRSNEEDWNHWLRQLGVELLRSSPSPSHGLSFPLAEIHEPFARQMLHSAFATCYGEMNESMRLEVVGLLSEVLKSPRVPSEVLQELLNLSEYMERLEIRLHAHSKEGITNSSNVRLFDLQLLMESSERCNLYSKALHYVEIEFFETIREYERSVLRGIPRPLPDDSWRNLVHLCEKSIYLCNLLGQRESANGVLKFIQQNFSMLTGQQVTELSQMMDAKFFDKLQWWSQSYRAYEQRLRQEPNKVSNMVGLLKALDALGSYPRMLDMWRLFMGRVGKKEISELAPMGAHAAWLMRRWDDMEHITGFMSDEGYIGTTAVFYRAVLSTRKLEFREAERFIKLCRKRLDSTLSALVAESYDRAYGLFVGIQQLSELEELAMVARDQESASHWQELWEKRLGAMAYEGWPGTLANHTLLIPPSQELDMWLRFVSLSRVNGQERVSNEILHELLGDQSIDSAVIKQIPQPAIALAAFQHHYETNQKEKAIELLEVYVGKVEEFGVQHFNHEKDDLAVCHAKLAEWLAHRKKIQHTMKVQQTILHHLQCATDLDNKNGAIWHTWARLHHEIATEIVSGKTVGISADMEEHIICAIDGYLRSVYLSQELEDALGFLSLWFMYGSLSNVQGSTKVKAGIHQVSPTVWLKVIPQIIARIFSHNTVVAESVYHLLVIIAKSHPQALLYSLNVVSTSDQGKAVADNVERKKGAQRVLARIAEFHHNGKAMVNDAALACRELVRCAVLWPELWFVELERAWYQWGKDKNAHSVMLAVKPLLEKLETPETMAECHFASEFGELLTEAYGWIEKAATLGRESYMDEVWSRFKSVVKRMNEQVDGVSSLALQLVSPRLLQNGKNLSLVVPGQYKENGNFPRIASFQSTLKVMNSKQRPRRIFINGSDGILYKFLLKGHEDLRLDERVMQLLGFANTILEKHSVKKRRDCIIQTYSVTPLSDNAGLVGWVDSCDTLHQIVKDYRVHSKNLGTELGLMRSMFDELNHLTVIQQVEPFEYALENTEGADLVRSFWMRAPSAEVWLERRTTYVCSLATMSMVGYILGLGDRHPSNLMIHAFSGRIVHIDFGDCFEAAQNRSAFPEKVPFRLTRMLVKAMEMGGIEGLFRHGCKTVMTVLREEGSSLLALLEAFVHDPLVSWWRDETNDSVGERSESCVSQVQPSMMESIRAATQEYNVGSLYGTQRSVQRRGAPTMVDNNHIGRGDEVSLQQTRKAQSVVRRIKEKLEGQDFPFGRSVRSDEGFTVEEQVSRLIEEATSNENLCVHYSGWCPFW